MSEKKVLSVRELETISTVKHDDYAKLLVERKINNINVSFSAQLNDLENFFITTHRINELKEKLKDFKSDLINTVESFVSTAGVKDDRNNYMLLADSEVKKSNLIRYDKLVSIMSEYITDEELETSIIECTEYADTTVANLVASMINSAVHARSTMYTNAKNDARNSELTSSIDGIDTSSDEE